MQEDKSSKWLAEQLRKQQEENQLPYEVGAWEAFQSKRNVIAVKKPIYWISGIAAAITLLLVAGGLWLTQETETIDPSRSEQLALEKNTTVNPAQEATTTIAENEVAGANESPVASSEQRVELIEPISPQTSKSLERSNLASADQSAPTLEGNSKARSGIVIQQPKENVDRAVIDQKINEATIPKPVVMETLIATNEKTKEEQTALSTVKKEEIAAAELPKELQVSEAEIAEILEKKSFASIAMGVTPGFGASQSSEQSTAGTSLGLGVMVDMAITHKLVMGSGLAVNYLNQASESQSYSYGGANALAASVTETDEITQVQVDIPLYFKYPITRSNSISVQAGFSNLVTFNQGAEQESSYTRQVAVYDATAANSFRLQSESVSQTQDLNVPNQKFYPFATANLGVNIRLFEGKKTSYEVMPFYNYPLQEFSGYGEKLGMFGASFKVNFGAAQKK